MPPSPVQMTVTNFRPAVATDAETANFALVRVTVPEQANLGDVRAEMVLVLDRSGSMFGPVNGVRPIDKVIDATKAVIQALRPQDRLGIVTFDDRARLLCPLTAGESRRQLSDAVARFEEECRHGGGGTELAPAIQMAVQEVRTNARDSRAARLVILTDGEAQDTGPTLAFVRTLERQSIAALGFGQFNFDFMNQVCEPSKGLCEEVGKEDPTTVKDKFMAELKVAQDTAASNLRLRVKATDYVRLRKSYIVRPRPTFLGKAQLGLDRELTIDLPILEKSFGVDVLFDLVHVRRDPGKYSAAELCLVYDVPSLNLKDQELVENIVVEYTTDPRKQLEVNNEVKAAHARGLDEELRLEYGQAEKRGDKAAAGAILETMRKSPNRAVADMATRRKAGASPQELKDLDKQTQQETRRKS